MSRTTKAAIAIGLAGICGSVQGQSCEGQWLVGYGIPGVNGSVNAMTLWDPDGAGPLPEMMIIAGSFSMVNKTPASNIAAWDGTQWSALGSGVNGAVNALAVYQGRLYAGGTFTIAGGSATGVVASWDGTNWEGTAEGPLSINGFTVYQNELVGSGTFSLASFATPIAKWNGSAWTFLGPLSTVQGGVSALAVYNGKLIAGGNFTKVNGQNAGGIAQWDGAWTPLGSGIESGKTIRALGVFQGSLFAGGNFATIGGVASTFLGKWDGNQWSAAGAGYVNTAAFSGVRAISMFDGKVVVGSDVTLKLVLAFDGAAWSTLGPLTRSSVLSLQSFGGVLFAGTEDGLPSTFGRGLVAYAGNEWQPIAEGFNGSIYAMTNFEDQLVVGGAIQRIPGRASRTIARWNGAVWSDMVSRHSEVNALSVYDGLLYAGGQFVTAFGGPPQGVGRWNGSGWEALSQKLPGTTARVLHLGEYQGKMLATGDIRGTSIQFPTGAWLWNGAQWQGLGDVFGFGYVTSSAVYRGDLYVAGAPLLSDPNSGAVLRYNGTMWQRLGQNGISGSVLRVYQDELVIAARDVRTPGGFSYGPLAKWNESEIAAIPVSSSGIDSIVVMNEYHGDLVIAGGFTNAFGVGSNGVVRWTGTSFEALGQGVSGGTVWTLSSFQDELVAGGVFTIAGGEPSANFARWTDNPTPWVAVSPESKPVNEGLTLTLSAAAASGYANASYQWKRNGVAISDGLGGASAGGGTVSGASGTLASPSDGASVMLTIAGTQASDAGDYTIEFDNTCNVATSNAASIAVNTCPGDLNADGFVNDTDFELFVSAYNILLCEDAAIPVGCLSDLNGDGFVDDVDFQIFVLAYDVLVCE